MAWIYTLCLAEFRTSICVERCRFYVHSAEHKVKGIRRVIGSDGNYLPYLVSYGAEVNRKREALGKLGYFCEPEVNERSKGFAILLVRLPHVCNSMNAQTTSNDADITRSKVDVFRSQVEREIVIFNLELSDFSFSTIYAI